MTVQPQLKYTMPPVWTLSEDSTLSSLYYFIYISVFLQIHNVLSCDSVQVSCDFDILMPGQSRDCAQQAQQ